MDVTAILLIEPTTNGETAANLKTDQLQPCWGNQPKGLLPILGRSLTFRLMESLALSGVRRFVVISAVPAINPENEITRRTLEEKSRQTIQWIQSSEEDSLRHAEEKAVEVLRSKGSAIIVARCNSYFELGSATALTSCASLPIAVLRGKNADVEAVWATSAGLNRLCEILSHGFHLRGMAANNAVTYHNGLNTASDLRRLTQDAFNLKLAFRPAGRERRPGVWVGDRAHIHRTARTVAPCYVGSGTKIRAAALVTRGSSIEHNCEVDCGTVVQASNVLPLTYLGVGLELLHSVAGARHIANAAKRRTAEITDPKLMRESSGIPAVRLVENAGKLAAFLPKQAFKALLGAVQRPDRPVPDLGKTAIATSLPAAAETALAAGLGATSVKREHGNE